jgi:hypothetical protein
LKILEQEAAAAESRKDSNETVDRSAFFCLRIFLRLQHSLKSAGEVEGLETQDKQQKKLGMQQKMLKSTFPGPPVSLCVSVFALSQQERC